MQPVRTEDPIVFLGQERKVTLPSTNVVTIRETNGDDDETLSQLTASQDGSNFINFLANIITHDENLGRKPLVADIMEYPIADKYYLMFKQRIINHGDILNFETKCQNPGCKDDQDNPRVFPVEQELNEFDGDLSDPNYKPQDFQVRAYPKGTARVVEFKSSKNYFRVKILDTIGERKSLSIPDAAVNRNLPLTLRELEIKTPNGWELVTTFGRFSSKEMKEIRVAVAELESTFEPVVRIQCPYCKTNNVFHLLQIPAFYFPEDGI